MLAPCASYVQGWTEGGGVLSRGSSSPRGVESLCSIASSASAWLSILHQQPPAENYIGSSQIGVFQARVNARPSIHPYGILRDPLCSYGRFKIYCQYPDAVLLVAGGVRQAGSISHKVLIKGFWKVNSPTKPSTYSLPFLVINSS